MMRVHRILALVVALTALTLSANEARGDFSGPYAVTDPGLFFPDSLPNKPAVTSVGTWTLSVDDSSRVFPASFMGTSSSQINFHTGADIHHGFESLELQFTHPIIANGTVSFDYALDLLATGPAASWNFGGYILNGVLTKLSAGTGSVSIPVSAGDIFGFDVFASVNCALCEPPFNGLAGSTTLTITNFSAPVPEPSVVGLLFCASAGLSAMRVRRRLSGSGRYASLRRF